MELEPMLTPKDVARHLAMCEKEVRKLCRKGVLEAINVGQGESKPRWRVELAALERFKLRRLSRQAQKLPTPKTRDYERVV